MFARFLRSKTHTNAFFLLAEYAICVYIVFMDRTVNRTHIDEWIDRNGPDGLVKLAQAAGVSYSLMSKVRNGLVPKKGSSRLRICQALSKIEDVIFPPLPGRRAKAS